MALLRETAGSVRLLLLYFVLVEGYALFLLIKEEETLAWSFIVTLCFLLAYLYTALSLPSILKSEKFTRVLSGIFIASFLVTLVSTVLEGGGMAWLLVSTVLTWYLVTSINRLSREARGLQPVEVTPASDPKKQMVYWGIFVAFLALVALAFWYFTRL